MIARTRPGGSGTPFVRWALPAHRSTRPTERRSTRARPGSRCRATPCSPIYAANKGGSPLDKWVHYFPIYDRHLATYRGSAIRVLEIGVYRGGGLAMLGHYLGPAAQIVGIDIDELARTGAGRHVVEIGDQEDPAFLSSVAERHGPFDIVIDDGGHTMRQQIRSVETLFPLLAEGGVYIVEDCHTSYWAPLCGSVRPGGDVRCLGQGSDSTTCMPTITRPSSTSRRRGRPIWPLSTPTTASSSLTRRGARRRSARSAERATTSTWTARPARRTWSSWPPEQARSIRRAGPRRTQLDASRMPSAGCGGRRPGDGGGGGIP